MALVEPTVRRKIENMHCARARLVRRIHPAEMPEIFVFALSGHSSARFCYAWEDGGRVRTMLENGLQSPQRARDHAAEDRTATAAS